MLLDTSGLYCLLHGQEREHGRACDAYREAPTRLTHGYVLAELIALANARGLPQAPVLAFVRDLLANPDIDTVWADEFLTSRAIGLLVARVDQGYTLADALSFVLMRDRGIRDALTTDHHFRREGLEALLS